MTQDLAEKHQLADRLSAALGKDEFLLYCQTIIGMSRQADERPFQEILIRFQEEETKLLPPGTFLPLLDEHGLMHFVDRWVINRLTKWMNTARSIKPDWAVPRNAINLSPQSLHVKVFPDFVKKHIDAARLPAGTFCFEMIWEDAVEHAEALMRMMAVLKPAGCRLTIARFDGVPGALDLLKMLAPDYVKLSPRVVMAIGRNEGHGKSDVARAISAECSSLGIQTIAEYVESEEVLSELQHIGVHYAQGFAIEAPKPLI